jgi:mevalonate kinase
LAAAAASFGGEAITVPLRLYSASLKHKDQASDYEAFNRSVSSLRNLYAYLHSLPKNSFHARSNLSKFNEILTKDYYIASSIPEEYGIGSSAAVSALVYDQFFEEQTDLSLLQQKEDLATIESCFHGKSSGVDALSSYLDQPVYFSTRGPEIINEIDPVKPESGYRFFLLDSRTTYKTAPLVKHFNSKMRATDFRNVITNDLLVLNSKFIGSLLKESASDPAMIFRAISDLQWKNFRKMIPESVEDIWIEGQVSNTYYLKLNGSGGGFMLGIAHEDSKSSVIEQISGFDLIWL